MTILVTGAEGMIGSRLVKGLLDAGYHVVAIDRIGDEKKCDKLSCYRVDLNEKEHLQQIVDENKVDRFIHLAALAHTEGETDLSWEQYKNINVDCAKNVFDIAGDRPLLFISTVDVFGFFDGKSPVNGSSHIDPVSYYGKSKALAENECKKLLSYTIFRLSPVYSDKIKRDIQKRYYIKYPGIAYQIGKGNSYEVLNINKAVKSMIDWCEEEPNNDIKIIKDELPMWTPDYIKKEKENGRARIVIRFPRWAVLIGYAIIKGVFGKNNITFLLNKAVYPLRSS